MHTFNTFKWWLGFFIVLLSSDSFATTVYKQVDKSGRVTYSDTPGSNTEEVDINTPAPIAAQPTPPTPSNSKSTTPGNATGTPAATTEDIIHTIKIISPPDKSTINTGDLSLTVTVEVNPPLGKDDKVAFYVDGKPANTPDQNLSITLPRFEDRGEHSIQAQLISGSGKSTPSEPITVYQQHHSILLPNSKSPPASPPGD